MIQAALHLTVAALICLLTGNPPPPVLLLCLTLALLPDLDTPKSIIGSFFLPVSEAIERRVGHRTATHSLLALLTVGGLVYLLLPAWWIPLTGSYASHILLDLLIGKQGVLLFWPHREWQALTSWRDDGPAPRRMLILLLPILFVRTVWPYVSTSPALAQPIAFLGTAANPIATSPPPSPTRTPLPGVSVSFALPAGVGMHSLAVQVGAVVAEGQPLARWNLPTPTPWPTPTLPPAELRPEPVAPAIIVPPPHADQSALTAAQAELGAAQAELAPQREALRLRQAQEATEMLRQRDQAALALAQLQPRHEREQAECQHAVTVAAQELTAAQAALSVAAADALPRAAAQVRAAQATLTKALDAQARMRTEQGVERERLATTLAQAQADLAALPAHHASERTTPRGSTRRDPHPCPGPRCRCSRSPRRCRRPGRGCYRASCCDRPVPGASNRHRRRPGLAGTCGGPARCPRHRRRRDRRRAPHSRPQPGRQSG